MQGRSHRRISHHAECNRIGCPHEKKGYQCRQNLCLRSLCTALALRLALAIPLLEAGHTGLADLRISSVEGFELIGRNNSGELDSGSF